MEPEEILQMEFKDITSGISKNVHTNMQCVDVFIPVDNSPLALIKTYYHKIYITKKYRDKGCAVFKVIMMLRSLVEEYKPKKVFWRVTPEIGEERDWVRGYTRYVGRFRMSMASD